MVAGFRARLLLPLVVLGLSLSAPTARAATCADPTHCTATPVLLNFESLPPGTGVEGPGAVYPPLTIQTFPSSIFPSCPLGSASVIESGNTTPFVAYDTPAGNNGCLNGIHGFADSSNCVLDYQFTFAAGYSVNCFSLLMVDYGDYFPYGTGAHTVVMTAYDASNVVVDTFTLSLSGPVQLGNGDACVSQAAQGRTTFVVTAPAITRVTLRFTEAPDPNVGFDDLAFCLNEPVVPVVPESWSGIKTRF